MYTFIYIKGIISQYSNLPFKLGIDENGNYGYIKDGADSVTPFKNLSDTTAVASQVTSGYVFYDKDGNRCVGTRPAPITRQTGSFQNDINGGNSHRNLINFSTPFDKTPSVSAVVKSATHPYGDMMGSVSVSVSEITRSSFVATVKNTHGTWYAIATIDWTAQA